MKMNRFLSVVACAALSLTALLGGTNNAVAQSTSNTNGLVVNIKYMLCPAPTSAANPICLGNQIQYVLNGWQPGYISQDPNDPTALTLQNTDILRPSQATYGPPGFIFHDCTNNPTGKLSSETGGRFDFLVEVRSTNDTLFPANLGYFSIRSTDANNNTWAYTGNFATNTVGGAPLVFSSQYVGEVMNGTNVVVSYHNGESTTNLISRMIIPIRDGYYCQTTNDIASVLAYTARVMDYTCSCTITFGDFSVTSVVGTQVRMSPVVSHNNATGSTTLYVEGQHGISTVTYGLQQSTNFASPVLKGTNVIYQPNWTTVTTNLPDGYITINSTNPAAYYRGVQMAVSGAPAPQVSAHSAAFTTPVAAPAPAFVPQLGIPIIGEE